jgi:hypothetical protein
MIVDPSDLNQSEDNMKIGGFNNELHPGITMHKIPVRAEFPGIVFTIGMLSVFLMGIPPLIYFLALATVLGIGFAVILHFTPRRAGLVAFAFTAVMLVYVAGIPAIDDLRRGPEIDLKEFSELLLAPPPPPPPDDLLPFHCDSRQRQSKQSYDRTTQRDRGQKRPHPQSPFDGTWEGKTNDLPSVNLTVADAGGGQLGGVVAFYFQMRGDDGEWRVAGKSVAPLLAAHAEGKVLVFEVQHHKTHGGPEFGPNVKFRTELAGGNEALLYNVSEPSAGPYTLTRRE